jgi:hypothetical protein
VLATSKFSALCTWFYFVVVLQLIAEIDLTKISGAACQQPPLAIGNAPAIRKSFAILHQQMAGVTLASYALAKVT